VPIEYSSHTRAVFSTKREGMTYSNYNEQKLKNTEIPFNGTNFSVA